MEIASLKHSMAANDRSGASEPPLSMFTSLDLTHNTQQLESAVETDKITAEAYQRVREEMTSYLSIPSQRLAHIGRRRRQKQLTENLVCEVRRELGGRQEVVEKVVERIRSRDQLQQKEFEEKMEGFRQKRTTLARELTVKLGKMEEVTKSLLIKPIYGTQSQPRHQDLITPLPRPVPIRRRVQQPGHSHKHQTKPKSAMAGGSRASNNHHYRLHTTDTLQKGEVEFYVGEF